MPPVSPRSDDPLAGLAQDTAPFVWGNLPTEQRILSLAGRPPAPPETLWRDPEALAAEERAKWELVYRAFPPWLQAMGYGLAVLPSPGGAAARGGRRPPTFRPRGRDPFDSPAARARAAAKVGGVEDIPSAFRASFSPFIERLVRQYRAVSPGPGRERSVGPEDIRQRAWEAYLQYAPGYFDAMAARQQAGKPLPSFESWLMPQIRRDVLRHVQAANRNPSPGRDFLAMAREVRRAQDVLRAASGKWGGIEPSAAAIAKYLGKRGVKTAEGAAITPEHVDNVLSGIDRPESVRLLPRAGMGGPPSGEVPVRRPHRPLRDNPLSVPHAAEDPEPYVAETRANQAALLRSALERMDPRDVAIVMGLAEGRKLNEIGKELGVSPSRMTQLSTRAMARLRDLTQGSGGIGGGADVDPADQAWMREWAEQHAKYRGSREGMLLPEDREGINLPPPSRPFWARRPSEQKRIQEMLDEIDRGRRAMIAGKRIASEERDIQMPNTKRYYSALAREHSRRPGPARAAIDLQSDQARNRELMLGGLSGHTSEADLLRARIGDYIAQILGARYPGEQPRARELDLSRAQRDQLTPRITAGQELQAARQALRDFYRRLSISETPEQDDAALRAFEEAQRGFRGGGPAGLPLNRGGLRITPEAWSYPYDPPSPPPTPRSR